MIRLCLPFEKGKVVLSGRPISPTLPTLSTNAVFDSITSDIITGITDGLDCMNGLETHVPASTE